MVHKKKILEKYANAKLTGRTYSSKIKYIFEGGEYGLEKGFCIMSLD